jgi:hypothetical protein
VVIQRDATAPSVAGVDHQRPEALIFYKSTCSVTEMVGPVLAKLGAAYPGSVTGVGQDPQDTLDAFAVELGWTFPQVPDLAPYVASDAYGIMSAPTVVVVDADGTVADTVESWDRDGMNRVSATLAGLLGVEPAVLSTRDDGLPGFKPG